jgi:hypothetical protein
VVSRPSSDYFVVGRRQKLIVCRSCNLSVASLYYLCRSDKNKYRFRPPFLHRRLRLLPGVRAGVLHDRARAGKVHLFQPLGLGSGADGGHVHLRVGAARPRVLCLRRREVRAQGRDGGSQLSQAARHSVQRDCVNDTLIQINTICSSGLFSYSIVC